MTIRKCQAKRGRETGTLELTWRRGHPSHKGIYRSCEI